MFGKVTLKSRIEALMRMGYDHWEIAPMVKRPVPQVQSVMWEIKNPRSEYYAIYHRRRYKTDPAYRERKRKTALAHARKGRVEARP